MWEFADLCRVERFGNVLFKLCFFLTISVYGYNVLSDKPWVPWVLGGSGSVKNIFPAGFLYTELHEDVAYYYLWGLSYHVMSLVYHLFMSKKADFLEMFLHHIVTIFLIGFSYMSNYVRIGSLVFYLHDFTDIFSYLIKSSVDTSNTALNIVNYILLLTAWGIGRLFIFPVFLIYETIMIRENYADPEMTHGYYFFNTCLLILQFLHIYWYFLFLRMGLDYATRGTIRDSQVDGFENETGHTKNESKK